MPRETGQTSCPYGAENAISGASSGTGGPNAPRNRGDWATGGSVTRARRLNSAPLAYGRWPAISQNGGDCGPPLEVLTPSVVLGLVGGSQRTASLPEGERGGFFDGVDLITALRQRGTEDEHVLLAGKSSFTLGSSQGCDVVIGRGYLSSSHCELERRGQRIRVHDLDSKNGTYFAGRREPSFDIGPGDCFVAASTTLYALNEEMRLCRPVVSEVLGANRFEAIDDLLIAAVRGSHMVVVSEPGNDQRRLAEAIHTASLRRRRHLVQLTVRGGAPDPQMIQHAAGGTLFLDLPADGHRFEPAFVDSLLSAATNVRLIVSARSTADAMSSLGAELVGRSHLVTLAALRERVGDIASLLERWLINRRSALRVADLAPENQKALRAYRWPGNLEELREAADKLVVLAKHDSLRQAAQELDTPRTTLQRWVDGIGLSTPLVAPRGSRAT